MSDDDHRPEHRPGEPRESAFFGRRKGKTLRKGQAERLEADLPRLSLDLSTPTPQSLAELYRHKKASLCIKVMLKLAH